MRHYFFNLVAVVALSGCTSSAIEREPRAVFTIEEQSVTYSASDVTLAAALLLPTTATKAPAVVIVHGSGESDRSNKWARSIAEVLAKSGVAVLLTDKRGSGASGGDWREADFVRLADDALAGVEFLRRHPSIDSRRIGLVGLSQGGQIVPLAATRSEHVSFVIAISGSATTPVEQVNHEMRNTFRQFGLDEAELATAMKIQERAGDFIRGGDWSAYARELEEARDKKWAPVAAGFPQTPDSWVWKWWRQIDGYDPIAHWRRVDVPVLIIYGAEDERDNVPVTESVRRLRQTFGDTRRATVRVIADSGHAIYAKGTTELHPEVIELLQRWVKENVR